VHDAGAPPLFTRSLQDQAAVDGQLPAATRAVRVAGVRGWAYPVRSAAGDDFQLFVWFDGSGYQVKVVAPDVGAHRGHAAHLFPDGRLCLGEEPGHGAPTLAAAYARSVLWANGFSAWLRTGAFPY
jgi:hypothetical protein